MLAEGKGGTELICTSIYLYMYICIYIYVCFCGRTKRGSPIAMNYGMESCSSFSIHKTIAIQSF